MQTTQPNVEKRRLSPDDVRKVAPALEAYTQERLYGDVWKRAGLAPRDRSLVTIAALIARDQSPALTYYFNQAIENGATPREISETITHLAFYAGWANAFAAIGVARDVFAERGVGTITATTIGGMTIDVIASGLIRSGEIGAAIELRDGTLVQVQRQLLAPRFDCGPHLLHRFLHHGAHAHLGALQRDQAARDA